jgi:hypothetical protein
MSEIPEDVMEMAREVFVEFDEDDSRASIKLIASAIMAERERCAAFAYAKWDWPPRWIAASLRGENSAYEEFRP